MKTLLSLFLFLAAFTAAHGQNSTPSSDEKAVLQVLEGTVKAWNAHDTKMYFSYFTEDAQWVNVVGMWWHNVKEHKYALDIFMDMMFNKTTHTILGAEVKMLRPDLALVRHKWQLDGWVMPDGTDMSAFSTGVMTMIMEKRNGKWLIIDGHNTSIDKKAIDPVLTMKK